MAEQDHGLTGAYQPIRETQTAVVNEAGTFACGAIGDEMKVELQYIGFENAMYQNALGINFKFQLKCAPVGLATSDLPVVYEVVVYNKLPVNPGPKFTLKSQTPLSGGFTASDAQGDESVEAAKFAIETLNAHGETKMILIRTLGFEVQGGLPGSCVQVSFVAAVNAGPLVLSGAAVVQATVSLPAQGDKELVSSTNIYFEPPYHGIPPVSLPVPPGGFQPISMLNGLQAYMATAAADFAALEAARKFGGMTSAPGAFLSFQNPQQQVVNGLNYKIELIFDGSGGVINGPSVPVVYEAVVYSILHQDPNNLKFLLVSLEGKGSLSE